jgi:transposase
MKYQILYADLQIIVTGPRAGCAEDAVALAYSQLEELRRRWNRVRATVVCDACGDVMDHSAIACGDEETGRSLFCDPVCHEREHGNHEREDA